MTCINSDLWSTEVQCFIPAKISKEEPVLLGIDEAGRGPVIGPMVYGCAFWEVKNETKIKNVGFKDSKVLTSEDRENLFENLKLNEEIGFLLRIISAQEINANMLKRIPYNLNEISHSAAICLVTKVKELGYSIAHVYIDTVGPPEKYEKKMTDYFQNKIKFTVRSKADSLFTCVSAASICAKVTRDRIIDDFKPEYNDIGSGYPSDPNTVKWLSSNIDEVLGYPDIVRFSWGTVKKLLTDGETKSKSSVVEWSDDENDEMKFKRLSKKKRNPVYGYIEYQRVKKITLQ